MVVQGQRDSPVCTYYTYIRDRSGRTGSEGHVSVHLLYLYTRQKWYCRVRETCQCAPTIPIYETDAPTSTVTVSLSLNSSPKLIMVITAPESSITSRVDVIVGRGRAIGGDGGVTLKD